VRLISVSRYVLAVTLLVTILVTGCTSLKQVETRDVRPAPPEYASPETGWWYARFRLDWAEGAEASWYMDLFLAHQIVLPILEKYKAEIYFWRFHRRAARDNTGHQFSFIFFCSAQTAHEIFQTFRADALLQQVKVAGLIIEDIYDDTRHILKPNMEDTSDKQWSPYIQETWPYYIMGVSRMWLGLITEIAEDESRDGMPTTVGEIETFYTKIDSAITALWENEGRHAFLHHLNAIFSYKPLIVYEKRRLKF